MAAANNNLGNDVEINLPGGSRQNNNFPICTDHGAIQNLFCTICIKGVCYRCLIESHNGHPLDYYNIAAARGIAIRNALSWEVEDAINELTVGKRRIFLVQKSMERQVKSSKEDIKKYIRKCHTALERREQDLLRRLSQAHKEKKSLLEQQQNNIEEQLNSLLKSYDNLYNHFSLEDPVLQAGVNSEALRELATTREIPLIPASNDRVHFWKDFGMRLRMRHYLGILDVGEDLNPKEEEDTGYYSPGVSDSDDD